jgi:hypothetical protein
MEHGERQRYGLYPLCEIAYELSQIDRQRIQDPVLKPKKAPRAKIPHEAMN